MENSLQELKAFLNKLFQFESQELDFGIYKILHYKRKEIKEFIDKLLVDTVQKQLKVFTKDEAQIASRKLHELKNELAIEKWLEARAKNDTTRVSIYEEDYEKIIYEYNKYSDIIRQVELADNTEQAIYNHLALFFSRYYDKGDFISKRRFGKTEKYVVPYNGEETHFYWANHDQYYIKSSEYFQHFAFKVPQLNGTLIVNFKLTDAHTEQGNVKADDNKYFILSDKQPGLTETELNIYFEFRALREDEKKTFTGNGKQDILNARAEATLKKLLEKEPAAVELWKEDDKQQTLLLRKLNHYTRKNSYDFFIHKDLKVFLDRELDFYIKSELVKVDDLYVLESEQHFNNIRHNFKVIKCFKNIAITIIDFLAQIEDFQKKLWEKKKFVLTTDYVITIDKLAAWLDKKTFEEIALTVLQNKAQIAEWLQLFGWDKLPFLPTIEGIKADLDTWRRLPVDTKHFTIGFKESLLNVLSEKINVEEEAGGLVIHSDNYHGLQLLYDKFYEQAKCIYIDPPYNTNASEIIYKNGFRNSSWVSMISDRLALGKLLLKNEGLICVTIDDVEFKELGFLIEAQYGKSNIAGVVSVRVNPSGRPTQTGFAIAHEYAIFARKAEESIIRKMPRTDVQLKRYDENDKDGLFEYRNLRREGSNSNREDGKRQYYPIYVDVKMQTIRLPKMEWDEIKEEWNVTEEPFKNETLVFPLNDDGVEKNWRWSEANVRKDYSQFFAKKNPQGIVQVYYKYRPNIEGTTPLTFWSDAKYSATEHGTKTLKDLFNDPGFSYPKSIYAVQDCISIMGLGTQDGLALDYFPGSGTTFHATQILNKEDEGNRKCILIEQGGYVYTVIIPRIKKIAYSFDWKDGKPQNMGGLGIFIKYQRLEQYEESLENIAFTASEKTVQQAMEFDQYIPKYFLELETRGSKTLVNIEGMQNPWGYTLKVWDGFTYDTEQAADLVETFNYLIGLHVQKYYTWQGNGHKYVFVWGWNNEQQKSLVIWRDISGWAADDFTTDREYIESKLKLFEYEHLYINGQSTVPGYQMVEDVFKTKMIPG